MVETYASFLGQNMIEQYGSFWDYEEYEEGKKLVIRFDENDIFRAFMVTEKFCNRSFSYFNGIYTKCVKNKNIKPKPKRSWWKF
jgi:hypothetical protein